MSGIGTPGLIIILLVAVLLFGPKKLPELGASLGETVKNFKKSASEVKDVINDETKE